MRIMHCPQHVRTNIEHNMKSAKAFNSASTGFTEMDWGPNDSIEVARRVFGSRFLIATEDLGGHSQENPIAYKRWRLRQFEGVEVKQLSEKVAGEKNIGSDRWMTIIRFKSRVFKKRKYFHMATHLNAGIQTKEGAALMNNDRWIVTNEAMLTIEHYLRRLMKEGREGYFSGDLNWRLKRLGRDWRNSPENVFDRLGMNYRAVGLDWLAWTKGLEITDFKVIPQTDPRNGSDHPWLVGDFKGKRRS